MSKITREHLELGYKLSLAHYKGEISLHDGVDQLNRNGVNSKGTARDIVYYISIYMKKDNTPVRTMSLLNQSIFMEGILRDLGKDAMRIWAGNDKRHFNYYEQISGARVIGRRRNLDNFLREHNIEL